MKVMLRKEDRKWISREDMPIIRWIIDTMKEDDAMKAYATMAIKLALGGAYEIDIYRTEAHISRNDRIENAYSADSKNYDVWITVHAMTNKGFVIVGAFLTDIWNITGAYGSDYNLLPFMAIHRYKEVTE